MRGARESLGRRRGVAVANFRGDVVRCRGPDLRCTRRDGGSGVDDARQHVVAHVDRFQRIARRLPRFRDDGGNGFADEANGVDGERLSRRSGRGRAVGTAKVGGGRQRLHAGADQVRPGHDGDDARHRGRGLRVDAENSRVRIRRAQEHEMRLPRQVVIVDELPCPREQALVLDAANGLAAAETTVLRRLLHPCSPRPVRTCMRCLHEFTLSDRTVAPPACVFRTPSGERPVNGRRQRVHRSLRQSPAAQSHARSVG